MDNLTENLTLNVGLIYSLLYGILMTAETTIAKTLLKVTSASLIAFTRCLGLVFLTPCIEWEKANLLTTGDLCLYMTCSIIGALPYACGLLALNYIGIGDSSAILFGSSILLVGVIGHFILGERISLLQLLILSLDCVGVILVTKPSVLFGQREDIIYNQRELGVVFSLIAAVFISVWPILVRILQQRCSLHCFLLSSVHGFSGMVLTGIWTTVESNWSLPVTWEAALATIGYIVFSVGQFMFASKALETQHAKSVGLSLTLSVALSYVVQVVLFKEIADWIAVTGALMVITCVLAGECWELFHTQTN